MARTVVAIYDDLDTANRAVRALVDSGVPRDNVSVIANDQGYSSYLSNDQGVARTGEAVADETGAGAGVGAGIGAAIGGIGGLLVGLGALTIPGIGPVIAAGPLAVALSTLTGAGVGAVAGGVTGGLLGALIGLGIPEEEAGYYVEGVRRGGVLVTVDAGNMDTNHIMDVLNRHHPMDINERVSQWRSEGWTGYDRNAGESMSGANPSSTTGAMGRGGSDIRSDQQNFSGTPSDRERMSGQDTYSGANRDAGYGAGAGMGSAMGAGSDVDSNRISDRDIYGSSQRTDHEHHEHMEHDSSGIGSGSMGTSGTSGMSDSGFSGVGDYDPTFDRESPLYRNHYNSYLSNSGYPYDYYLPAYQYGHFMRSESRYQNRDWNTIESDVRTDWERYHPGTWERFKMAIRHAWEDVTGNDQTRNSY